MAQSLDELIPKAERDQTRAPIAQAMTPPAQAYTSPDMLRLEWECVFGRSWIAVCFDYLVPDPGDVFVLEFAAVPLLVVRGEDRVVRTFHNICPYDGCPVAMASARGQQHLRVAYHGWIYDLQGKLVSIPYWDGNEEPDPAVALNGRNCDLTGLRTEEWHGLVLVNPSGDAPDVEAWFAPFRNELGAHYDLARLHPFRPSDPSGEQFDRHVRSNWKTYIENACINILHEAHTHHGYATSPDVPRVNQGVKTHFVVVAESLHCFGFPMDNVANTYPKVELPHLGHTPDKEPVNGYFWTMYPNICGSAMPTMITMNICVPESPDRCRILHGYYFTPAALEISDFEQRFLKRFGSLDLARREDLVIIEAVQRARSSPVWRSHFYAPFWDELHYAFNARVMQDLELGVP